MLKLCPIFEIGDILVSSPNSKYLLNEVKIVNLQMGCYTIQDLKTGHMEKEYIEVIDKVYVKKPINTTLIWNYLNS